jgi:hypothetical protein
MDPRSPDHPPRWPLLVLPASGLPGLGLLAAPTYAVTCAHLLDPAKRQSPPDGPIELAGLFDQSTDLYAGELAGWRPDLDLALIRVTGGFQEAEIPSLRYPERLGIARGGHRWKAWAIPDSAVGRLPAGVPSPAMVSRLRASVRSGAGRVADRIGPHRYQVLADDEPPFESGFSGSALRISDTVTDLVVGILTSRAGSEPTSRIAFLVTLEAIVDAFPVLRPWVGWHFRSDGRLRAAWRWEDRDLRRPTLGSYFTGRVAALRTLDRLLERDNP